MSFPVATNLGNMISARPADHPWLIEVTPSPAAGEVAGERVFSYGDLREQSAAVARALQARGLAPGARVGMLGGNSAQYVITYFGIMQAGYCPVPIGIKLARDTVEHILADASVELLYVDSDWGARLTRPETVGTTEFPASNVAQLPLSDRQAWQAHLNPGEFTASEQDKGDFATILYTSGSTGVPKGVPLTHGGYIWTLQQVAVNGGTFMHDNAARVLAAAPLSHMNALVMSKMVTAYGGTLVLMTHFSARGYLQAIADHRCAIITCVPTMLALCAREQQAVSTLDLSSVRIVAMGSSPVTDALFEQVAAMFPNAVVSNGWGTTETGPAVFGPHPDGLARPPLSLGHPLPGVQVRLENGADPQQGELLVKNGAIMPGYLNRDAQTRQRVVDGWYRTGDVMRRDANGFYFFVGRVDDMFVCGGENVYPGEVEILLERHPGVAQAAVVPVADEIKGQIPAAFIVRKPGSTVSEAEIKAFALANGPAYQHPRFVRFVDAFELSAANKIDKKHIAQLAAGLSR